MSKIRTLALVAAFAALAGGAVQAAQSTDGLSRRVRVHNQTGLEIKRLQAADVRTGQYAEDLLAGAAVAAGASRPVTIDAGNNACLFDLRAELSSGQAVVKENVNVCRVADVYLTR